MIKLTPRRQGLWELLFVGFCQLLPLIFGIPLLAMGLTYLYKGELVGSILILAGALLTLLVFSSECFLNCEWTCVRAAS